MGLRIISGNLKGKRLYSVPGTITRPTADRLRESIFNIIAFKVRETVVLDLFAGTGAFGIEALSRGAELVVFIDRYQHAVSVIEKNISSCGITDRAKSIKWDIIKNLNCIKSAGLFFNLVFMDPPYNKNMIGKTLRNLHLSGSLEKDACIVVEHSLLEPIPDDLLEFELVDQRKYGKTLVSFLNYI
jgi:16S rRNA (guanine966-N2)-methyltransferase